MVPARKLVYDFKRRLNHRNTSYSTAIDVEDICSYLNEAQNTFFEKRVEQEGTSKIVKDDLRPFEINDSVLELKEQNGGKILAEFKNNHYQTIRQRVDIYKEGCGLKEGLPIRIFKADSYDQNIPNTMWSSSYEWEDVMAIKVSKGFQFKKPKDFEIKKVLIDYYRKPTDINAPSLSSRSAYIDSYGNEISEDSGTEFSTTLASQSIVDLAVLYALRDIGDIKDLQTQQNKIINF